MGVHHDVRHQQEAARCWAGRPAAGPRPVAGSRRPAPAAPAAATRLCIGVARTSQFHRHAQCNCAFRRGTRNGGNYLIYKRGTITAVDGYCCRSCLNRIAHSLGGGQIYHRRVSSTHHVDVLLLQPPAPPPTPPDHCLVCTAHAYLNLIPSRTVS